jgi:glycolate oxidase iron-sulfur subunit
MSHIDLLDAPDFRRKLDQCIHCGLCLPACPTYAVNQLEMDSPRGRIALMRGAADGRIGLEGAFQEHIDLCLGCRACETACPSGVQYGLLLETYQGGAGN